MASKGLKGTDEAEMIRLMGNEVGAVFNSLHSELCWLHAKWLQGRKIFATSAERIDLLKKTAPFFFVMLQKMMWEDVLLHIARLTDEAKKGKYSQMSFFQFGKLPLPDALKTSVDNWLKDIESKSEFARTFRHKRLAHNDFDCAVEKSVTPLTGGSRADIEDLLTLFRELMNSIFSHYTNETIGYEHVDAVHDADELMEYLGIRLKADEERRARLRKGEIARGDLE